VELVLYTHIFLGRLSINLIFTCPVEDILIIVNCAAVIGFIPSINVFTDSVKNVTVYVGK